MTQAKPALTLLGPLALRLDEARQKLPFAGQTKKLFIYLAGHANLAVRRDVLLQELWPDVPLSRAQSGLNTATWRIKRALEHYLGFEIQTVDDVVRLAVAPPARIDSLDLEAALSNVEPDGRLSREHHAQLMQSVKMYRGPFLDGCSDHWVLPLREKFAAKHVRALTLLMRNYAALGDYDSALEYGRAILELDSFREGTQREVIWLYALNGQRARAMTQYRKLEQLLDEELGIKPMPETVALHQKIALAQDSVVQIAADCIRDDNPEPAAVPAICLQT